MTIGKRSTVVGVFEDRAGAQKAVAELRRVNFGENQIGVVSREVATTSGHPSTVKAETGSKAAEGAAIGVAAGAGVGALWALGIVSLGLPAVGPVIAGGIFASILASAAGTAVAGGILGSLIGLGIPEEEAKYYEGEFQTGRTLVTVKAGDRYKEAEDILHRQGGYNIHTAPTTSATV